jgi:hypothetical protein
MMGGSSGEIGGNLMSSVFTPATFTGKVRLYAQQARRLRWLPVAALVVVAVAACLVGRLTAPGLPDMQGPPSLTLPPHASLVRWEEYPHDHEAIWYYSVPDSSHRAVMSFFKRQMTQGNWSCVTSDMAQSITQNGQSFTGSNGYLAARNGSLDVQINTGDQSFGAFLLQHDLDEHAIALKIDVSTTDQSACGGK